MERQRASIQPLEAVGTIQALPSPSSTRLEPPFLYIFYICLMTEPSSHFCELSSPICTHMPVNPFCISWAVMLTVQLAVLMFGPNK